MANPFGLVEEQVENPFGVSGAIELEETAVVQKPKPTEALNLLNTLNATEEMSEIPVDPEEFISNAKVTGELSEHYVYPDVGEQYKTILATDAVNSLRGEIDFLLQNTEEVKAKLLATPEIQEKLIGLRRYAVGFNLPGAPSSLVTDPRLDTMVQGYIKQKQIQEQVLVATEAGHSLENINKAILAAKAGQPIKDAFSSLTLLEGITPEEYRTETAALNVYGPEMLVMDFVLGFGLGRKMGQSLITAAMKGGLGSAVGGATAFGIMDFSAEKGHPIVGLVGGILGGGIAASLVGMGPAGIANVFRSIKDTNPNKWDQLYAALPTKARDSFEQIILDAAQHVKSGKTVLGYDVDTLGHMGFSLDGTYHGVTSPAVVLAATGDDAAVAGVKKTINAIIVAPESEVAKAAESVAQVGPAAHVSLFPEFSSKLDDVLESQFGPVISQIDDPSNLPYLDLAQYVTNASAIGRWTAHQRIEETLRQLGDNPDEMRTTIYINDNRSLFFGPNPINESALAQAKAVDTGNALNSLLWVRQPSRVLGGLEALFHGIPSALRRQTNAMASRLKTFTDEQFKGLSKTDAAKLDTLLQNSNDEEKLLQYTDGFLHLPGKPASSGEAVTEELAARYFRLQWAGIEMADAVNKAAINRFKAVNAKYFNEQAIVVPETPSVLTEDVRGIPWKAAKEAGMEPYLFLTPGGKKNQKAYIFLHPDEVAKLADLSDNLQLAPFVDGYSPRVPTTKTPWVTSQIWTETDGTVKTRTIGLTDSLKEADRLVAEMNQAVPPTAGAYVVRHRRTEDALAIHFAQHTDIEKIQSANLSQSQLTKLITALENDPNIGPDVAKHLRAFADSMVAGIPGPGKARAEKMIRSVESLTGKQRILERMLSDEATKLGKPLSSSERAKVFKKFIDEHGTPVEYAPSRNAMARYVDRVANFVNLDLANTKMREFFLERYGQYLQDPSDWKSAVSIPKITTMRKQGRHVPDTLTAEVEYLQNQMKRLQNLPSQAQAESRIRMQDLAYKLFEADTPIKNRVGHFVSNYLQDWSIKHGAPGLVSFLNKVGTHALLGFTNLSQAMVQSTGALNISLYADKPHVVAEATSNFTTFYTQKVLSQIGWEPTAKAKYLMALYERSGIIAGFDFEVANDIMRSFDNISGKWGATAKRVDAAFMAPLKFGEDMSRGFIAETERLLLDAEIKAGKFKHAVGSEAYFTEWIKRTNDVAGDFTKANVSYLGGGSPARLSQIGGATIGKFTSWPIEQAEKWVGLGTGKVIPGRETSPFNRVLFASNWLGLFGTKGIPMFDDIRDLTVNVVGSDVVGRPDIAETLVDLEYTLAEAGIDYYEDYFGTRLTDNLRQNLKRQTKYGLSASITEGRVNIASRASAAAILGNYIDGLAWRDLMGPGASVISKTVSGFLQGGNNLLTLLYQNELEWDSFQQTVALPATQGFPGINNYFRLGEESILSRNGNTIDLHYPTTGEKLQAIMGITPGRIAEDREFSWDHFGIEQKWKAWVTVQGKEIGGLLKTSPDSFVHELEKAKTFLIENGRVDLVKSLIKKAYNEELLIRHMDPADQTNYRKNQWKLRGRRDD